MELRVRLSDPCVSLQLGIFCDFFVVWNQMKMKYEVVVAKTWELFLVDYREHILIKRECCPLGQWAVKEFPASLWERLCTFVHSHYPESALSVGCYPAVCAGE